MCKALQVNALQYAIPELGNIFHLHNLQIYVSGLPRPFCVSLVIIVYKSTIISYYEATKLFRTDIWVIPTEGLIPEDFLTQTEGHYSENQCYNIGSFQIVPRGCVQKSPGT